MKNTFENIGWMNEILEFSETGLWRIILDQETGMNEMYVSKSMLNLLGLEEHPSSQECYNHWYSKIEPAYEEYVNNGVAKMIATRKLVELQYPWRHPTLGSIYVRCSGKVEKVEGSRYEFRGYHQNISAMEFLKSKENMTVEEFKTTKEINTLRSQVKHLNEQSKVWKTLMRTVLQNSDTFEIYYYPKERKMCFPGEIALRNNWEMVYYDMPYSFSRQHVDPESQRNYNNMFENIHIGIETSDSVVSLFGGKKWFKTNLTIIESDEDGNPTTVVGIVEDITEKKINQLENIQLNSIYKFTVNNDYECLLIIDLETHQYSVRYTENWEMYNATADDTIKDNFKTLLKKIIQPTEFKKFNLNEIIRKLKEDPKGAHVIWYTALNQEHKEASCYWIEENKKILVTIRNIEKRWLEEEENKKQILEALEMAEAASQAKSDFLSRMSHDIRTPLNAVVGMVAIAKKYMDDKDKVAECLDSITNSSNYLTSLINDVLDMSKIEHQKLKLSRENFDLNSFIAKMLDIVKPLMDSRKHTLIVDSKGIVHSRVKGDAVRLQQLLLNIISNAVKYTHTGGKIDFTIKELSCDREGYAYYQFNVKDNGMGMDEEFLKRLFNPFERQDSERVSLIEGTGLGMSIAQNIARLMDGEITVESEVDKGSDFTITIYLELQTEEELHEYMYLDDDDSDVPNFSGQNILLVEDNLINMQIAEEILSATGANIETAENGAEAVEKVQNSSENYYSLIFMDIRMPILNGYEAVKQIRALNRVDVKTVPIIAMTADAFTEDIKRAKDCGMNDHISKPIDLERLYSVMKKIKSFENFRGGEET